MKLLFEFNPLLTIGYMVEDEKETECGKREPRI